MAKTIKNEYLPDFVSHPGTTLIEALDERGMSQADLSRRLGRPKKTVNEIIQGKAAITSETALQLEKVLDIPSSFWVNRQRNYDEFIARVEDRVRIEKYLDWIDNFSITKMTQMGWINKYNDKIDQTLELLRFFGVASPDQWDLVTNSTIASFKLAKTFDSAVEDIAAWLRKGELIGQNIYCEPYDQQAFTDILHNEIRSLTLKSPSEFQPRLIYICASVGVAVAFVPQLPNAKVSGVTRWLSPDKALIQLSLRYKSDDQLWFTFFHEAAHIIIHGKRDIYLESINRKLDTEEKENEASKFAADILIPPLALSNFLQIIPQNKYPSQQHIIKFSKEIGIAPSIIVGRLQHDKLPAANPLPYSHYHDLKEKLDWVNNN